MRRSTAGRTRSISSYWCGVTGDDDAGRSALPSAYRDRARFAGEAHKRAGIGRGGNCPARALRGTPARLFVWAPEQARAVADAADAAFSAGVSAGPLQGLPVSIKDLFAAAGYPCFAGSSRRLPADPWERDGPLVATLRRQLGVIMGKTHMVEFAFGGTGRNSSPWGAVQPVGCGRASLGRRFRAAPGSVCWKARLCSRSAAIRPARCASPHA